MYKIQLHWPTSLDDTLGALKSEFLTSFGKGGPLETPQKSIWKSELFSLLCNHNSIFETNGLAANHKKRFVMGGFQYIILLNQKRSFGKKRFTTKWITRCWRSPDSTALSALVCEPVNRMLCLFLLYQHLLLHPYACFLIGSDKLFAHFFNCFSARIARFLLVF